MSAYGRQYDEQAGRNHYRLLAYISSLVAAQCTVKGHPMRVCELGTLHGDSARAWHAGSGGLAQVHSFDLRDSAKSIASWQPKLSGPRDLATSAAVDAHLAKLNISLHTGNMLEKPELFRKCLDSTIVLLDTEHLPDKEPFEMEFLRKLSAANYRGLVFLDDIWLNKEMADFWRWVKEWTTQHSYKAHDLTLQGHWSGSGLVDLTAAGAVATRGQWARVAATGRAGGRGHRRAVGRGAARRRIPSPNPLVG